MSNYYMIHVKLTKKQQNELIHHIASMSPFHLVLNPSQIDIASGEAMLVTKAQLMKLITAKKSRKKTQISYSRTQLKKMYDGMMAGHGILDSIGNFFKGAVNKVGDFVGRTFWTVRNYVSTPQIMPP